MNRSLTLLAVCFCAGLLGALCSSLVAWQSYSWGLPELTGVRLSAPLTPVWLYPRLVWGGLWGLIYFLAVGPIRSRCHWARKGLWISLLPTAFHLFVFFPYLTSHGLMGFGLGQLTPLFIFGYNLVWGFCTGFFCRLIWGKR